MKAGLILIFLLAISCSKGEKKSENTLNYALTSKVSTIDPAISYDTVSAKVVNQIYETLYEYDYLIRPYQLKPLLARELPIVEENGLKYTIKLKKNIEYHPHPSFNNKKRFVIAQDFINHIKRLAFKPTKANGWWLFENKIVGLDTFRKKAKKDLSNFFSLKVKGLEAADDHTLVIRLKRKYPQLKYALAMAFTTPMPRELIEFQKNDFSQIAIGTGPYILQNWVKSSSLTLKRNKNYHTLLYPSKGDRISYEKNLLVDSGKKLPFIDTLKFHIMEQAQTRWLNFLKGNIDLIVLTKDHFSLALDSSGKINKEFKDKGVKLQIAPTLTYWWLSFNMTHPILGKNLLLRSAIAHAIDIDEYINSFTNNIALKANSIYPPGVFGYTPTNKLPYTFNKNKAKELLAKAGYPDGKGLPVFNYDVRGSTTVSRQMGEYIKKELEKIGIKINLVLNTFPKFLNKARTGQLQIWQGGWSMDYPDPENVIQLLSTKNHPPGPNSSYFSNTEVDSLYNALFEVNNKKELIQITNKVQKIVTERIPWVMQFYSRNYILHHDKIRNFRQSDLINNNFKYLRIE